MPPVVAEFLIPVLLGLGVFVVFIALWAWSMVCAGKDNAAPVRPLPPPLEPYAKSKFDRAYPPSYRELLTNPLPDPVPADVPERKPEPKAPAPAEAAVELPPSTPLERFQALDAATKAPRKKRSDAGKPRGPRLKAVK
jgi:hypothetical protein